MMHADFIHDIFVYGLSIQEIVSILFISIRNMLYIDNFEDHNAFP